MSKSVSGRLVVERDHVRAHGEDGARDVVGRVDARALVRVRVRVRVRGS